MVMVRSPVGLNALLLFDYLKIQARHTMAKKEAKDSSQPTVRVRYEGTDVVYASQFVVNANQEDITVNCSAGYITDPNTGENLLPIHSRVVVTPIGAKRLIDTLTQALENLNASRPSTTASTKVGLSPDAGAKIPKIN